MKQEATTRAPETEPAMTELNAPHIEILQGWTTGESWTISVMENTDLDQVLREGTKACDPHEGFTRRARRVRRGRAGKSMASATR